MKKKEKWLVWGKFEEEGSRKQGGEKRPAAGTVLRENATRTSRGRIT